MPRAARILINIGAISGRPLNSSHSGCVAACKIAGADINITWAVSMSIERSHNSQLLAAIECAVAQVDVAKDKEGLLLAIRPIKDFSGSLRFNHTAAIIFGAQGVLIVVAATWLFFQRPPQIYSYLYAYLPFSPATLMLALFVLGLMLFSGALSFGCGRANLLPDLSERIARLSSLMTQGLMPDDVAPEARLESLQEQFSDYYRGNYSHELVSAFYGTNRGSLHSIRYGVLHLHYVNERIVRTRNSSRKVYYHYDRFSLVASFPWVAGISVRSDSQSEIDLPVGWNTASSDFNGIFELTGNSEIGCAKFAKPATVLHLLKMSEELEGLNLEFSAAGNLCMSFEDSDILGFDAGCSLSTPDAFHAAIQRGVAVPRLDQALALIHRLAEQQDNNLAAPAHTKKQTTWSAD